MHNKKEVDYTLQTKHAKTNQFKHMTKDTHLFTIILHKS